MFFFYFGACEICLTFISTGLVCVYERSLVIFPMCLCSISVYSLYFLLTFDKITCPMMFYETMCIYNCMCFYLSTKYIPSYSQVVHEQFHYLFLWKNNNNKRYSKKQCFIISSLLLVTWNQIEGLVSFLTCTRNISFQSLSVSLTLANQLRYCIF